MSLTHSVNQWINENGVCRAAPGFKVPRQEAVSEWVTERVLREDKNLSTWLTMSDPQIMMPNEPYRA